MKVELKGLCKSFGDVVANDGVELTIEPGEVIGLLGENGAGKSTLMKLLYGAEQPDRGEIAIDGEKVRLSSPRVARALGVGMVFQQFSLIPTLTVAENLLLGLERTPFLLWKRMPARREALAVLERLAPELSGDRLARELATGEKQMVELAKVLFQGASVVILDEPTSVLARPEAERLWERIRELKRAGRSVVLITHKLDDVEACADRAVVMRSGRVVLETSAVSDRASLIAAMIGESPRAPREPRLKRDAEPLLEVSSLGVEANGQRLDGVSFSVARGSVLGIAGVSGNGQELLARVLAGLEPAASGSVRLAGEPLRGPADPRVAYIPEQPLRNGNAVELSVLRNLTALSSSALPFWIAPEQGRSTAQGLLDRFDVRPRDLDRPLATLSGGNVQKLVAARELGRDPLLLVACFPTMGLDVGAASRLLGELRAQAERGAAVVWIGEDLDLLFEHADAIAVLHRGRLTRPVDVAAASRSELGRSMVGVAA